MMLFMSFSTIQTISFRWVLAPMPMLKALEHTILWSISFFLFNQFFFHRVLFCIMLFDFVLVSARLCCMWCVCHI